VVFDDDGENALKISLDSLDTDFPRFEIVLVIFAGFGVSGDFDSEVMDDNDFGTKDDVLLRIDEDEDEDDILLLLRFVIL